MDPEVLLLDEPTSNLDPRAKWDLIEQLQKLSMTKLIASHDLELISALCQRTIVLDKGQVIADDATCNILSNNALLEAHCLTPRPRRDR